MPESADEAPLVSVVVPTYGRPATLVDALESVNTQTYEEVEAVVVDDHSPESVEPLVREQSFPSIRRVEGIRHDENRGANAARNTGIDAATGELVAFLDDDDVWDPDLLEREVAAFREGGEAVGVVYVGSRIEDSDGDVVGTYVPAVEGEVLLDLFCGRRIAPFSNIMVRASVIEAAGRPDERFPSLQDREWHFRLAQHCEYRPIREALVTHRSTAGTRISDEYERKRDVTYPLFVEKHRSLAAEYGPYYERRFVASLSKTVGAAALANRAYLDALVFFGRSLRYYPFSPETWLYLLLAAGGRFTHGPATYLKRTVTSVVQNS